MSFTNSLKMKSDIPIKKMMPITQQVFLFLFYHQERIIKSEIANILNVTRTSLTRATEQLLQMELITEKKEGKMIYVKLIDSKESLLKKAKAYFINPVQTIIYVDKRTIDKLLLEAGETALSKMTMINSPQMKEYAIYKNDEIVKELKPMSYQWEINENMIVVQLWKYDPGLFAQKGCVDPISLLLLFGANYDERIEMQLSRLEEDINGKWN